MVLKTTLLAPAASDTRRGFARELRDVHVAGSEVRPGGGDTDLGLAEVRVLESRRRAASRGRAQPSGHRPRDWNARASTMTDWACAVRSSFDTVAFGRFKPILLL